MGEYKRICQCRKCKNVFDVGELVWVKRKIYNLDIEEKRCPYCNGEYRLFKDGLFEKNRDRWILHNPPTSDEKLNWKYFNRENN